MADGEKKRFGNFAEYAKARQAGKVGGSDGYQIAQVQCLPTLPAALLLQALFFSRDRVALYDGSWVGRI